MSKIKQRDWSVELMRIIACVIVIGCHTVPQPISVNGGGFSYSRVFLQCLFGDGVAIFWVITGFFLFINFDYAQRLKRTAFRIVLPTAVYSVFVFYLYEAFVHQVPLLDSLSRSENDYIALFRNAISLNVIPPHSGHLWYVVAYILLVIISPLFCAFAQKAAANRHIAGKYLLFLFAFLLLNDLSSGKALGFSHHGAGALSAAAVFVLYGNVLYQNRSSLTSNIWVIAAPVLFIICNLVRMKIQIHAYAIAPKNNHIIFWYTTFGIINATLIAAFCFSLSKIHFHRLARISAIIGSYTFAIYVIHIPVRDMLRSRGIFNTLMTEIIGQHSSGNMLTNTAYHCSAIFIVFFASLSLCVIFRILKCLLLAFAEKINDLHLTAAPR